MHDSIVQPSAAMQRSSDPPTLSIDAVSKSFGEVKAVDQVTLAAQAGQVTALLGPNGAGKTTLLRMVIGMLGPDQGHIRYCIDRRHADRVNAHRVGYLPEERGLYLDVPVRRLLLYFAALRGMHRDAAGREADRWLTRFDLADRASDELRALSKGNQQKVQFISAILHRPALAILDEPFSGLDPVNQDFFLDLIRELSDAGTAVVLSAHQMQLVERIADRIVLIRRGRVVSQGTVPELRQRWGTGRRLRVSLARPGDAAFLEELPAVRSVTDGTGGEIDILLEPEAPIGGLLEALGTRLEVRDLEVDSVSLHDIYLRTAGSREEVAE